MFKLIILGRAITDAKLGYNRYTSIIDGLSWSDSKSLVLLPDYPSCQETAALYQRELASELAFFFVPDLDYCLDKVIDEHPAILNNIQKQLDTLVSTEETIQIIFFRQNPYLVSWTKRLKHKLQLVLEPAHYFTYSMFKSIFHRSVLTPTVPAPLEKYPCIRVPTGYVATDKAAVLLAFKALRAQGIANILVKPVDGYLGKGIETIDEASDIQHLPERAYVVEEKLTLDRNAYGMEASYATNFYKQEILQITTQLVDDKVYSGTLSEFLGSEPLYADIKAQSNAFLAWAMEQGMQNYGGIDFLVQDNLAYLVDNNLGRMTAAQGSYFFKTTYAPNRTFMTFYSHRTERSVEEVWQILKKNQWAFDKETQIGIFPFAYIQHEMCKMIALHHSTEQAYEMAMAAKQFLEL
jgi:hypothetical protein